ncbi:MAG: DNA mismatch repair endonuclease MutL, partial [Lachnospiraceae bacterium]
MAEIRVLDQRTINQIAAGEVIERPASVVKELAENAMDAKATMITVEIKEGGIDFIRITDNGFGIEKEQVETAFLPHATSKIRSIEDLLDVASLGFRGEALASIASVAKVELITKTDRSMTGVRYQIEGGQEIAKEEIGCPVGTTFVIKHLFYNTPARRKFLKSKNSEAGYIEQLLYHLALSHSNISFKLIVNNKNKLNTNGNGSLKDVIYQIYGKETASNLIAIKAENSFMKIEGLIGKPILSRGNRQTETYFINKRYIKSKLISKAIEEAYKSFVMVHKYPFTVLHIEINPELLDVNVHPAKMEVRMKREEEIYSFVYTTIKEALNRKEMIPDISLTGRKKEKSRPEEKIEPFEVKRGGYGSPYIKPKVLRESEDFFEKPKTVLRAEQKERVKQELKTLEEILRPIESKEKVKVQKETFEKTDITDIDVQNKYIDWEEKEEIFQVDKRESDIVKETVDDEKN